jgi:hypothetical protein
MSFSEIAEAVMQQKWKKEKKKNKKRGKKKKGGSTAAELAETKCAFMIRGEAVSMNSCPAQHGMEDDDEVHVTFY